ncbi:ABC transporter ATP-binding protein [Desulfospira joergensenii]|uniref:ABC transporter ATP-binding protein n=1 Tax=Desulfospira joergensenii TaxID=53329 RepID=UPI0003B51E21|nr:ABC transporter ATP-binding protein [Desulfospira joergensenii]
MLEVSGVEKQFNGRRIFSGFDLKLAPGRFKVLVGPSGCGKSTLFDALTGATGLDRGKISWQGRDLPHLGAHAAYMQQKDLLLPWFSLLENALLPAKVIQKDLKDTRVMALDLFRKLGLEGFEDHRPGQVSGGMRQRCALVRTLIFDRDLVFLDEPLSALDAITRRGLHSLLLMLQTQFSKTLLMITHDIEEALLLGDEVCLLSPRPMEIQREFILNQPKPRRFNDPELLEIKEYFLARLEGDLIHGTT